MRGIYLGLDIETGRDFEVPLKAFETHLHMVGGTGKGKTTAIHTMLHALLADRERAAVFVIDPLGNLSFDLLRWMTSRYALPSGTARSAPTAGIRSGRDTLLSILLS